MARMTKEEREEYLENLQGSVEDMVNNFKMDPEVMAEVLEFESQFYNYSQRNCMLLYMQNQNSSFVQSYKAWNDAGYHIKKGEEGAFIMVPAPYKLIKLPDDYKPELESRYCSLRYLPKELRADYDSGKLEVHNMMAYKYRPVFDISQTDFPREEYPRFFDVGIRDENIDEMCDQICIYAKNNLDINVSFESTHNIHLRGYYTPDENDIVVSEDLQGKQKLSTLLHELGHGIMHNLKDKDNLESDLASKYLESAIEVQADVFSIMIEKDMGLDEQSVETRQRHLQRHYKNFLSDAEIEVRRENRGEVNLKADEIQSKVNEKVNDLLGDTKRAFNAHVENINSILYPDRESLSEFLEEKREANLEKRNVKDALEKSVSKIEHGSEKHSPSKQQER